MAMKNKRMLTVIIAAVLVVAVAVLAAIVINNGSKSPEDSLNAMVNALNNLDFDAYVNTLHPALRADARKGMTPDKETAYMHSLRAALLEGYPEGTKIQLTVWESYDLDSAAIISIEDQYKKLGYSINVSDAKMYYYYSVILPSGEPEGLDSITLVCSNGKWYLLI